MAKLRPKLDDYLVKKLEKERDEQKKAAKIIYEMQMQQKRRLRYLKSNNFK